LSSNFIYDKIIKWLLIITSQYLGGKKKSKYMFSIYNGAFYFLVLKR
jgi:hypothetical protein